MGNFSIPFSLTNASGSNVVSGQVLSMFFVANMTQFTLNTALGTNGAYNGGTLAVAGHTFNVLMSSTNGVRVPPGSTLNFLLHDDDDDSLLPTTCDVSDIAARLSQVYIVPFFDGGGDLSNNQTNVPFVLNTESSSTYRWDSRSNNALDYWVVYLLAAYQDSYQSLAADFDSDSEAGTWASANNGPMGSGVLIYSESMRDGALPLDWQARVTVHEIGHNFGLPDRYASPTTDGVMHGLAPAGAASTNYFFIPQDSHDIRRISHPN